MAVLNLQAAIDNKNFPGVLVAYDLVETESFDWDEVPDYIFEDWCKLVDEGNALTTGVPVNNLSDTKETITKF